MMSMFIFILILLFNSVKGSESFEDLMVVRFCDEDGDNVLRKEEVRACLSRVGPEQRSSFSRVLIENLKKNQRRRRMSTTNCHTDDNHLCSFDDCSTCNSGYNEHTCLESGGNDPEWCACEFLTPHNGPNNEMVCADGHICNGNTDPDEWGCCASHGNRKQCPQNLPYMCANPNGCGNGQTYCCQSRVNQCNRNNKGGLRICDENTCGAYSMASNLVSGPSDGCTNGIQLKTKTDKMCMLSLFLSFFYEIVVTNNNELNTHRYRIMWCGIQRIRRCSRLRWRL